MPVATLGVATVLQATGWTGATPTALNTSDNVRATGGTAGEVILVDLVDVPTDWQAVNGDIFLDVEGLTSGNATRDKRVRLELLDNINTVLGTGETPVFTTTETEHTITISGRTDTQAAANLWRVRLTVLEGNGKGDSVSVGIDRLRVRATYDNSVPQRTGSGTAALLLGGVAVGGVEVAGTGALALPIGGLGAGAVAVDGSGSAALQLGMVGTGGQPTLTPRVGTGLAGLTLGGTGAGRVAVGGDGVALFTLGAVASGWIPVSGAGTVGLALGAMGRGDNAAPPPPAGTNDMMRLRCRPFQAQRILVTPLGGDLMTSQIS